MQMTPARGTRNQKKVSCEPSRRSFWVKFMSVPFIVAAREVLIPEREADVKAVAKKVMLSRRIGRGR